MILKTWHLSTVILKYTLPLPSQSALRDFFSFKSGVQTCICTVSENYKRWYKSEILMKISCICVTDKCKRKYKKKNYLFSTWSWHMAYENDMGVTSMHILKGFLIFASYFFCKILKGVRRISSHEARLYQHMVLVSIAYNPRSLVHWEDIFDTSN